jgi:hypothetical protein
MVLKPYADDATSMTIGELTLENGQDCVALYGKANLTRDKQGLAQARAVRAVLDAIVHALEADPKLPEAVAPLKPVSAVKNPFT